MWRKQQSECRHLGPGNYIELQFLINQAGPSFWEVTLVQNQTVAAEAAGTTKFLEPLCPLGVQLAVWLFILRFEHADDFLWRRKWDVKSGSRVTEVLNPEGVWREEVFLRNRQARKDWLDNYIFKCNVLLCKLQTATETNRAVRGTLEKWILLQERFMLLI